MDIEQIFLDITLTTLTLSSNFKQYQHKKIEWCFFFSPPKWKVKNKVRLEFGYVSRALTILHIYIHSGALLYILWNTV